MLPFVDLEFDVTFVWNHVLYWYHLNEIDEMSSDTATVSVSVRQLKVGVFCSVVLLLTNHMHTW